MSQIIKRSFRSLFIILALALITLSSACGGGGGVDNPYRGGGTDGSSARSLSVNLTAFISDRKGNSLNALVRNTFTQEERMAIDGEVNFKATRTDDKQNLNLRIIEESKGIDADLTVDGLITEDNSKVIIDAVVDASEPQAEIADIYIQGPSEKSEEDIKEERKPIEVNTDSIDFSSDEEKESESKDEGTSSSGDKESKKKDKDNSKASDQAEQEKQEKDVSIDIDAADIL